MRAERAERRPRVTVLVLVVLVEYWVSVSEWNAVDRQPVFGVVIFLFYKIKREICFEQGKICCSV